MKMVFILLNIAGGETLRDVDTILLYSACEHFYSTLF